MGDQIAIAAILGEFRQCLTTVIPYLERAHVPWKNEAAYDEWDDIASAIYRALVCSVICDTISKTTPLVIAEYGMVYDTYIDRLFVGLYDDQRYYALVEFKTNETTFDTALCCELDRSWSSIRPFVEIAADRIREAILINSVGQKCVLDVVTR